VVPLSEKIPLTLLNLGFPEYRALTYFGLFLRDSALRAIARILASEDFARHYFLLLG